MGLPQLKRLRNEGVSLRGDRIDFALTRARWDDRFARTARASHRIEGFPTLSD